jgi:hypothetical protein
MKQNVCFAVGSLSWCGLVLSGSLWVESHNCGTYMRIAAQEERHYQCWPDPMAVYRLRVFSHQAAPVRRPA